MLMREDERYPVRCRECGQVLAVRSGNIICSSLRHRTRKKEIHIRLFAEQKMTIVCERCECVNTIVGN